MTSVACGKSRTVRQGFTLIELLVVIAIIAILAAILFPVFAKAKESSKRSACIGNIKQIGQAMKMYQDDYSGSYLTTPYYAPDPHIPWGHGDWARIMWKSGYTKGRSLFSCPGAANQLVASAQGTPPTKVGYGYNEYIWYAAYRGLPFSKESAIPNLKYTVLFADCYSNWLVHDWNDSDPNFPTGEGLPSGFLRVKYADGHVRGVYLYRHGASNIVFCDLHVATMHPGQYKYDNSVTPRKEWPVVWPGATPYR